MNDSHSEPFGVQLTDLDKQKIERIGAENFDYCLAAVLNQRYPNLDIHLDESDQMLVIDGSLEIDFNEAVLCTGSGDREDAVREAVALISKFMIDDIPE